MKLEIGKLYLRKVQGITEVFKVVSYDHKTNFIMGYDLWTSIPHFSSGNENDLWCIEANTQTWDEFYEITPEKNPEYFL